ncbi:MAG TPA: hypothetical protein PKA00_07750 [Saprospiraceae bacterium]|nr:hypothetical protein [Saprospiraceae bacterium]HMQ82785.1 hypothetical protein [Saprospiraceae bacterium]
MDLKPNDEIEIYIIQPDLSSTGGVLLEKLSDNHLYLFSGLPFCYQNGTGITSTMYVEVFPDSALVDMYFWPFDGIGLGTAVDSAFFTMYKL